MKIMATTTLFLGLVVLGFLWMADTKITFDPFTFHMEKLHRAIGFFLILIGIGFIEYQSEKIGAQKLKNELIKELEKLSNEKSENKIS